MYRIVRLKLTLLYSALFFIIFWSLSFGLYSMVSNSLGESYLTQVRQRHLHPENLPFPPENIPFEQHAIIVNIAGTVALEHLQQVLLLLNTGLLLIVPLASWFLTGKTLEPLQKNHEQQRQFVSDASHELRTPLSIISGEMEVALTKARSPLEYKNVLRSGKEEIDRLTTLVENLLYLARSDDQKIKLNLQAVDITDLLSSLIAEFKTRIKEKKINIDFQPPKMSLTTNGQTTMLQTLFRNLLDNAIKYSIEGGHVWIKIAKAANFISVEIKDDGTGIPYQDKEKIFERFYRVDTSRSETKGFGLGLSLVKSIVEYHQGKIMVKSIPGKGSTFTVFLPVFFSRSFHL